MFSFKCHPLRSLTQLTSLTQFTKHNYFQTHSEWLKIVSKICHFPGIILLSPEPRWLQKHEKTSGSCQEAGSALRAVGTKPDNLSLIPGNYMVEGRTSTLDKWSLYNTSLIGVLTHLRITNFINNSHSKYTSIEILTKHFSYIVI